MTNLIPVWKEPSCPPPHRLSSKLAYKHRSCHPSSPGLRRTCHRASHMLFAWANSGLEGPANSTLHFVTFGHSGGWPGDPATPTTTNTTTTTSTHYPLSCLTICWRAFTPSKSLYPSITPKTGCEALKKEIWIRGGGDRWVRSTGWWWVGEESRGGTPC